MRLIYFSFDYCSHDHRFLSALSETDHEVYYVRLQSGPRQTEDRPVPSNIQQVRWAGGRSEFHWRDVPRDVFSLKRVIQRVQPDLIHAGPIQTCAFISAMTGFHPILTISWGFDLMQDVHKNRWMEWITRFVLHHTDYFTSDARVTRDKAVAYGMNPERTVVFPWGVDLAQFSPTETGVTNPPSIVLLCNRSWEPLYGVDVLAKAFVTVARKRPDLSLLLLGSGSQGTTIRHILERGGVMDRVTFSGQISQTILTRYYHMADLYISPAHVDGSSVSLMEALACGLPCLVSDIPGNKEWISEGENGWLFPDGDAPALAEKIIQIVQQPRQLKTIGQKARDTAEQRADWKKNFGQLMHAYELTVNIGRK